MIITSKTPHLDLHGEIESKVEVLVNDFINENILLHNDVVVIKEDNNDLDKDISNELEDNNYNKEELPIKDAKEELNDKNNKKKKKKKMEFEEL